MQVQWLIESIDQKIKLQGNENWQDDALHIHVTTAQMILGNVEAKLSVSIAKDEKIFMNGYQTWTYSPELTRYDHTHGLKRVPKSLLRKYGFDRYGDYHFVDYPQKKGITHGESWCYFRDGKKFRLFASLDEDPGYTLFWYDANKAELTIQRDCKDVQTSGVFHAFDLFYAEGSEEEVFQAWFDAMELKPLTTKKLFGYSSWYNHYQNINEEKIRFDLSGCDKVFQPNDLFQIDDGWEPFVGDWLETDVVKFPNGLKVLVDEIHAKGYKTGLWLAPFVAEEKSSLYQNHPDWFLHHHGKPWCLGANWSGFYSLDIDHPDVIAYLKQVFHQVYDVWGFDLVKLDFLYGAAPFGNVSESRAKRMKRALEFLRDISKGKEILACGVPLMPSFGLVEYCRIGCDVGLDWDDAFYMRLLHRERISTKNAIVNTVNRRQLNKHAFMNDPDVFFIRTENIHLSDKQKDDLARIQALLGGVFLTSDSPANYTDEMVKKYQEYRKLASALVTYVNTDEGITIEYALDGQTHLAHFDCTNGK